MDSSFLDNLDSDSLNAIFEAANLKNKISIGETKYRTDKKTVVRYEHGKPVTVVENVVSSYKDKSLAESMGIHDDKILEYEDWFEQLPDNKKNNYKNLIGPDKKLLTPDGIWIRKGIKSKTIKQAIDDDGSVYNIETKLWLGLGDADDKYKIAYYDIKQSILDKFAQWVDAKDFYSDLYSYPSNYSTNDRGTIVYCKKDLDSKKINKFIQYDIGVVTNDSELVTYPFDVWVPPSGYLGTSSKFINNVFALVVDIDSVYDASLYKFFQHDWGLYNDGSKQLEKFPKPTYIVNSGSGLHLYYVLNTPVPYFSSNHNNSAIINELLHNMQYKYNTCSKNKSWRYKVYDLSGKPQRLYGISQAFRMAGSSSKFNRRVTVYKYGNKYDIKELLHDFGLDDAVDYITLRHDDRVQLHYQTKEAQDKKAKRREDRINRLRDNIVSSSTDLYNDLYNYACTCAGAGHGLDDILDDCSKIINDRNDMFIDFDLDDLSSKISDEYLKISKPVFVDNSVFSFNKNRSNKNKNGSYYNLPTGYYIGLLNSLKNNIFVGYRRASIYGLGLLAYACGLSESEYKSDMYDVYSIIKNRMNTLNEKTLSKSDFESAIKSWQFAKNNKIIPSAKMLTKLLGPSWPNRPSKESYNRNYKYNKNNEHYETYCVYVALEIISYLNNKLNDTLTDDISYRKIINGNGKIIIPFPTISDLVKYNDFSYPDKCKDIVTKNEFIFSFGTADKPSRYFYSKYYNEDMLAVYYKLSSNLFDDFNLKNEHGIEIIVNILYFYPPKDRVKKALIQLAKSNDNNVDNISNKDICGLTGLSKPSVIKYLKELGCDYDDNK